MTDIVRGIDAPRPSRGRLLAAPVLLAVLSVACSPAPSAAPPTSSPSGGPSAGPTGAPSAGPTSAPTTSGGIAHPTGAGDVVLRIEEVGGFVPIEFNLTYTPTFTLYGDGTVIWRDNMAVPAESSDELIRPIPLMIAKIDEAAMQVLLAEAIGPGGLGAAEGTYGQAGGDIPSTVFTVNAGDLPEPKRVEVIGMSPDLHPQNLQVVTALVGLAEKLRAFDTLVPGQPYVPPSYRGVLNPTEQAFAPAVDWPWTDLSPADFGGDAEFFKVHELTVDQISKLGITDYDSGVSGFVLKDGDDLYNFAIRPLLPDELS